MHGRLIVLVAALGLGCEDRSSTRARGPVSGAEFGILFGGQIQERNAIPFELDRSKQTHGFRLEFAEPSKRELEVRWEIDMPGSTKRVRDLSGRVGKGRVTKLGDAKVPAGQSRFERSLAFRPGDPLGLWNVAVVVEEQLVIDRMFEVFDARARKAAIRRRQDAGP